MYGSSDSLAINNAKPSVYPIYVTANRQAAVEIYRNGLLINTQAVAAGLQTLDTRPLPGGIYEVEVRLVEDGLTTSTTQSWCTSPATGATPKTHGATTCSPGARPSCSVTGTNKPLAQ